MTKVKILSSEHHDILERMVNEFASRHRVLNVAFNTARLSNAIVFSTMIIYEED